MYFTINHLTNYEQCILETIKNTINPLELFVEKRQFFNQNNQKLNNITYHLIADLLLF